jgi:hypothetical protein
MAGPIHSPKTLKPIQYSMCQVNSIQAYHYLNCMQYVGLEVHYSIFSNAHPFYSFRGPKSRICIRIGCVLDSCFRARFSKNDTTAVHAVRTIQYNHLLSYLLL